MNMLSHSVSGSPVVARSGALFVYIEILRIVYVLVCAGLYAIDHLRNNQRYSQSLRLGRHILAVPDRGGLLGEYIACRRTGSPVSASIIVANVSRAAYLVEEDVLPVTALGRKIFEVPILRYAMLLT